MGERRKRRRLLMSERMTKEKFVEMIEAGWKDWEAAVAKVPGERMMEAGVSGFMSLKDVMAHVTWYEREMVRVIKARAVVGSELWGLPLDERNAAVYEEIRNLPLEKVLADSKAVHAEFMEGVRGLSEDELNDHSHFAEMPEEWLPWEMIASNC